MREAVKWLAVLGGIVALYYVQTRIGSDSGDSLMLEQFRTAANTGPEAREWLRSNKHPGALASNRFGDTDEALAFVEELYRAGAAKVVVSPDSIQAEPDLDGDYADALIVVLPDESPAKNRVIEIGKSEAARDGMELGPETEHGLMFLWWD